MGTVERTHPPTPRRLAEARKQGRFARSEDLAIAASLLLLTTATALMGSRLTTEFAKLIRDSLAADAWRGREIDSLTQQVQSWMGTCLHLLVPVLGITFAVSIAVRVLQSGFTWNFHHIQPDIVRLDPVQGMMRMASGKKLLEAIMNILKVSLVAVGVAWSL
ncbi:MAG: EscU/YscU/HrcU family type III secretion system export apparatus switch protein, partial [Planctomycetales bacterium]|nr:EscU/YscU/HrcU family type III secretion system export apparatus switch protein [Planctomycetales bacterium]